MLSRQLPTRSLPIAPVPVELLQTELQVYSMVLIFKQLRKRLHVARRVRWLHCGHPLTLEPYLKVYLHTARAATKPCVSRTGPS